MYTYNELYQTCDRILELFVNLRPRLTDAEIYQTLKDKPLAEIISALQELVTQKCVIKENTYAENAYSLLGFGRHIFENGGLQEHLKELNRQEEFKQLLDEYSLKTSQSVIDTNALVGQNVKTQERLTKYALTIAVIAAVVPATTLVKDILRPTQLIDTEKSLILKQQVAIDSLRQSLNSVNSSLKQLKTISYKMDTTKTK
jgi:hypothetical protein